MIMNFNGFCLYFTDDHGIVHGEYGFLTADNVYHLTAYMTDENGNYRLVGTRAVEFQTCGFLAF